MTYEIRDGWVHGSLSGPGGKLIRVRHFPQEPYSRRNTNKPNLVLHTTETDGYVERLQYPSEFQVGEGFVGQHKPLWSRGDAVLDWDAYALQVEIVGRSRGSEWLPADSSLDPLVALMAFLHQRGLVKTALARPANWPVRVDYRGSCYPATECYYRRQAGLWPGEAGVYGHIEIPGNTHWDPGGLNYPKLFEMVRAVLEGDAMFEEWLKGWDFHEEGREFNPEWAGPVRRGYKDRENVLREAAARAVDSPAVAEGVHTHGPEDIPHFHDVALSLPLAVGAPA